MSVDVDTSLEDAPVAMPASRVDGKENMFDSFFERSGLCVAHLDHGSRVGQANGDFCRQFGFNPRDVRGAAFTEMLHPSVREKVTEQIGRLVHGQRARFSDRVVALRSGEAFTAELTGLAIHGAAGQVEGVMVLLRPERGEQVAKNVAGRGKKLLTGMDARILEGIAAGVTTPQLATRLYLSRGGVEYHVAALLRKLKVTNRAALISKAYSRGIFGVGSWPPKVLPEFVRESGSGAVEPAAS